LDGASNSYVGVLPAGAADANPGASGTPALAFQTVWETDAAGVNLYQSPSWYKICAARQVMGC